MSSVCKSSVGCVDARVPVRATYVNLYKWPESDAEFVKWVAGRRRREEGDNSSADGRRKWPGPSPRVVDSYSCRQMYLRSYTFSKKESFPEKTQRCLGKVKERAAVCPFLHHQRSDSLPSSIRSNISSHKDDDKRKKKKKKKKKKGTCVAAKKLIDFIFRRLLSCTSSVDVVDRSSPS